MTLAQSTQLQLYAHMAVTRRDHSRSDHMANLLPELRQMICEQLSPASLKNVRLTDKSWGNVAAKVLWRTFVSDLRDFGRRDFDALLTSRAGGFLDCVRVLKILNSNIKIDLLKTRLHQLLSVVPRGRLSKFVAYRIVHSQTLGILIKTQPVLNELSLFFSDRQGFHDLPNPSYIAGNLDSLKALTILLNTSQFGYGAWFPYMPSLRSLTVQGVLPEFKLNFQSWVTGKKLQIQILHLGNMSLSSPNSGDLNAWTDLNCLEQLSIQSCEGVVRFVDDLAKSYSRHETHALRSLVIWDMLGDEWINALEDLLNSIKGLECLDASTFTAETVEVGSICNHGAFLRYLVMDNTNSWEVEFQASRGSVKAYETSELHRLAVGCPHLEEFGTNLVLIDFSNWEFTRPFIWQSAETCTERETELALSLNIVATFPRLRVLRITQLLFHALELSNADFCRQLPWRLQQFAEQILRYLADKGSSVKLLAFSPIEGPDFSDLEDRNGHAWPHYYYIRGESTTVLPRDQRITQIVAVPVKKEDIALYIEEPRILSNPDLFS